jgi:16S rRNA (cytosine1402-N4)-methyltransferase
MHVPVLVKEVIEYLDPKPNQNFIDATIGGGGHAKEILEKIKPNGKVLGIDWNEDNIMSLKSKFKKEIRAGRLNLVCDNFSNLRNIRKSFQAESLSGILFDLGLSRNLLEESGLGFSFQKDEPLIMTYHRGDAEKKLTAYDLINFSSAGELADIFRTYGEEKFSKKIASAIVKRRKILPIQTSGELARIVEGAVSKRSRRHPATRVFQAIRIVVNNELENLSKALWEAVEIVDAQGRIVVISYHSLEDRIVKNVFREAKARRMVAILTPKPVRSKPEEIKANPASRSAKLRLAKKEIRD